MLLFLQGVTVINWCYNLSSYCGHSLPCHLSSLLKAVPSFFVSMCFLVIIVSGMARHDSHCHSQAIAHLSFLLTIQLFSMGAISLLPTSDEVSGTGLDLPRIGTWTIDFICTFLSWMIVVTTPNAPPIHYPLARIYGPKALPKSVNFPKENVSGEYGMSTAISLKADHNLCNKAVSLFGKLFFSYADSIFMLGGSKKLITFEELPILPARLRAVVNLSQIRYARRYIKLPFESLRQLGCGYELAYQLLRVNFSLVCTIQLLSVITAAMYYAPIASIQFF